PGRGSFYGDPGDSRLLQRLRDQRVGHVTHPASRRGDSHQGRRPVEIGDGLRERGRRRPGEVLVASVDEVFSEVGCGEPDRGHTYGGGTAELFSVPVADVETLRGLDPE